MPTASVRIRRAVPKAASGRHISSYLQEIAKMHITQASDARTMHDTRQQPLRDSSADVKPSCSNGFRPCAQQFICHDHTLRFITRSAYRWLTALAWQVPNGCGQGFSCFKSDQTYRRDRGCSDMAPEYRPFVSSAQLRPVPFKLTECIGDWHTALTSVRE